MSANTGANTGADAPHEDDSTIVVPLAGDETVVVPAASDETVVVAVPRHAAPDPGPDNTRAVTTTPWADQPIIERGLMRGLPVSYGARRHGVPTLQTGVDEVQQRVGAAPGPGLVSVRPGREQLPSLAKRSRRRRLRTLVGYVAIVLLSAVGLWGVASIAFDW